METILEKPATKPLPEIVQQRIETLEESGEIFSYTIDGWCAWPLLRLIVARKMEPPNALWLRLPNVRHYPRIVLRDIVQLLRARTARTLVKTCTSGHAVMVDGHWKDHFFDDVILAAGNCFKLEMLNNIELIYRRKAYKIPAHMTTLWIEECARGLSSMWAPKAIDMAAQGMHSFLCEKLQDVPISLADIRARFRQFYWSKRLYALLLWKVKPAQVLTMNFFEHAITAAAKENGIPVIECQHGSVSAVHTGYSWTAAAKPYKKRMQIPDKFFTYGSCAEQELRRRGFWDEELICGGSLRIDDYLRHRPAHKNNNAYSIVVTMQGWNEDLIQFLKEFLALMPADFPLDMRIKLHPGFDWDAAPYKKAFAPWPHVSITQGDDITSTLAIIDHADVHVSIYSTCHYEAIALGIPTVVIARGKYHSMLPLIRCGHATLIRSPADLRAAILCKSFKTVPQNERHAYIAPGALKNLLHAMA